MRAEPIVNGLEKEWAGSVQVVQVNILDRANQALVERLDARFTPTFVLFDANGEEAWRSVGSIAPDEARAQVEALADS
jgi:thioredoxin-related protein